MAPMCDDDLFFRLDQNNRIMEVGGSWDRVAKENGAPELVSARIRGQSLFAHVLGQPTRDFVWTALDAARKLRRPITQIYRCDSPGLKRFMEMTIALEPAGGLHLRHRQISAEPLATRVQFQAVRAGVRQAPLTIRCSCCNRLKVGGIWMEVDQAIEAQEAIGTANDARLSSAHGIVRVAYGVCRACRSTANRPGLRTTRRGP